MFKLCSPIAWGIYLGISEGERGGLCSNTLKDNFAKFSSWFVLKISWHYYYTSLVLCSSAEEFLKIYWNGYVLFYSLSNSENELELAPLTLQDLKIFNSLAVQCTAALLSALCIPEFSVCTSKMSQWLQFFSQFLWGVMPTFFHINFHSYSLTTFSTPRMILTVKTCLSS